MSKTKRKWDVLTDDQRSFCLREIMTYYKEKQEQEIGNIMAEDLLDFFLELTFKTIYEKGVNDSRVTIKKRLDDIDLDLDLLIGK